MDMREAADRLLAATEARRVELGKKWKQVYEEAGLTHQTLNRWRKGMPVDLLTERAFERALLWAPGAREAIAAGRQPELLGEVTADGGTRGAPSLSQELDLAWRLLASTVKELGLSPDEAEEAWQLVREDIKRSHQSGADPGGTPETPRRRRAG